MTFILYSAVDCTSLVHVDCHACTCVHIKAVSKIIVKCVLNCIYIVISHSSTMDNMMLLLLVLPLGAFSYRYDCK